MVSYCNKHELSHALPEDLLASSNSSAKPDGATPEGKALNRILANKHMHESVTTTAPKLDPNSTADQAAEPVAGPSKSKADKAEDKQQKKKEKEKAAAQPAKSAPAGSSTFLPSLSAGFTMGDSDNEDDYSLSEGEDQDPALPQRKNRRGQRARRA